MSVNFELYKVFVNLVQNGSLNKSANELGVTPSAVSQSLKNLESALGVQLFERRRSGLVLTIYGQNLFNDVYKHARALDLSEHRIKNAGCKNNSVIVAASPMVAKHFVVNNLSAFKEHDIFVRNHLSNHEQIKAVEDDEADFAIAKDFYQSAKDTVLVKKIGELNYVFFYNPKLVSNDDIKNSKSLSIAIKGVGSKIFKKNAVSLEKIISQFKNKIMLGNDELIIEYVKNNKSIGFVPKEYLTKEFQILDLGFKDKTNINIIYKPENLVANKFLNNLKI